MVCGTSRLSESPTMSMICAERPTKTVVMVRLTVSTLPHPIILLPKRAQHWVDSLELGAHDVRGE